MTQYASENTGKIETEYFLMMLQVCYSQIDAE